VSPSNSDSSAPTKLATIAEPAMPAWKTSRNDSKPAWKSASNGSSSAAVSLKTPEAVNIAYSDQLAYERVQAREREQQAEQEKTAQSRSPPPSPKRAVPSPVTPPPPLKPITATPGASQAVTTSAYATEPQGGLRDSDSGDSDAPTKENTALAPPEPATAQEPSSTEENLSDNSDVPPKEPYVSPVAAAPAAPGSKKIIMLDSDSDSDSSDDSDLLPKKSVAPPKRPNFLDSDSDSDDSS